MKRRVVILGAGFGGLELASRLSAEVADDVHVTLVDRSDAFVFGFSKLEIMFGRKSVDDVRTPYRDIAKPSVEFRQELVTSIDASSRVVATDRTTYEADVLVVALGADYAPETTPGFVEGGSEYYSVTGAERMREVLEGFGGGRVIIGVLGVPFKCPPAPFEAAFLLHDFLVDRGLREGTEISMYTPMPAPIPPSPETSKAIVDGLAERGIPVEFGVRVNALDPSAKEAVMKDRRLPYDLFIGIPVHKPPDVVVASGLCEGGNDGWIKVDPRTLLTPYENVYAIGDVADAPVPRAGVFAENAAITVAEQIVASVRGETLDAKYGGRGNCYIEFGGGRVGRVDADFLSGPSPVMPFTPPSREIAREKEEFASSRRVRWFGS